MFDLYLYGVDVKATMGGGTTSSSRSNSSSSKFKNTRRTSRKHPLKIALGLKTSWFYTLQIKWGATTINGRSDGGNVHNCKSFYVLCENSTQLDEVESFSLAKSIKNDVFLP